MKENKAKPFTRAEIRNGANHMFQIIQPEPNQRKSSGENAKFPFLESSAGLQEITGRPFRKAIKYTLIWRNEGPNDRAM